MMMAHKLLAMCLKSQEMMVTEGQVLGKTEGQMLGKTEGHVLSMTEGHVLSMTEGHVLSMTEGHVLLLYMYVNRKSLSIIRSIYNKTAHLLLRLPFWKTHNPVLPHHTATLCTLFLTLSEKVFKILR